MTEQNMDKKFSDLNGSRLPSSTSTASKTSTATTLSSLSNEERLQRCLYLQQNEYSPKEIKLPFFYHKQHHHNQQQLHQEQQFKHSDIETPFIASYSRSNHHQSHHHRIKHPNRWLPTNKQSHRQQQQQQQHRHQHHNCHPQRRQMQHHNHHQHHHRLNEQFSDEHTNSTQKHFSKKFSFTQHCNHLSRFYMIFVIFLIYLLDKTNCDQGKCVEACHVNLQKTILFSGAGSRCHLS